MYICSVDLASQQDYTAIVVAERQRREAETRYEVCHIERLPHGTRYPEVMTQLQVLMRAPPLAKQGTLIADVTGVGLPIFQTLQQQGLRPQGVLLHGGDKVSREGAIFRVPAGAAPSAAGEVWCHAALRGRPCARAEHLSGPD